MDYILKRSKRKTIGLEITDKGLVVRAPLHASQREIERVIRQHREWILRRMAQREILQAKVREKGLLSREEIKDLSDRARAYIPQRVAYYAPMLGVQPGRITIRTQKTRWGSCSAKGNLNFNCLLMLTPPEVIDSVVVHELCHLLEMNHSNKFYNHVRSVFPDYWKRHAWLREHGPEIMARAHSMV